MEEIVITKVEHFENSMWISDRINKFLSERDVEYVDMKYIGDLGVLLVYREKQNKPQRGAYERCPQKMKLHDDEVEYYGGGIKC